MFMVDNQVGGIGMITGANGFAVSEWRTTKRYNTPEAILDAAAHLNPGDIILIEAQTTSPTNGSAKWPVEIWDSTFDAIRTATAEGIIVVEAAGNGAHNLDAYRDQNGRAIFNRTSRDFRDSGAIMVGGSTWTVPHRRWYVGRDADGNYTGSNYGSRIDVYSWAEAIATSYTNDTGTQNMLYTTWFGGTSGASPIIVSAVAIVQGISIARHGTKFGPLEMREILSNVTTGTPSGNPSADQIGVQPDLQKILDNLFPDVHVNDTADVYLRDYVQDTGEETTSSSTRRVLHRSPDIIVRQQPVADPVAAFGPTSGTVNNGVLSQDVRVGEEHSLYFRLANRGDREANNVSVSIYWAVPSTLVAPNTWNLIGTVSYPDPIPNDDTLIVSPRLAWPASLSPPEPGHYCFVAIADASPGDAAPPIPERFDDYERFVQGRNNVVWRNFNAVTDPPSDPEAEGWHKFKILIPGAWDSARVFTLKAHANLPIGSKVRLRVPQDLATPLDIKGCKKSDKRRRQADGSVVRGIEPQNSEQVLGSGELAAGSKAWVELEVNLPDDAYNQDLSTTPLSDMYSVALSQETGGNEVGRITYVFGKTNI
jgi:serine protease